MYLSEYQISKICQDIRSIYPDKRWSNGYWTKKINDDVQKYILNNDYYSLPCSSGTMALSVAIMTIKKYLNLKDRKLCVAIPAMTSFAVKFAVQICDCDIIYYPLDFGWNIDLNNFPYEKTPDVLIVVHSGGLIDKDIKNIKILCDFDDIFLIEDISHSQCSEKDDIKAGINSDFTIFSMYATKSLNSGEGGVVSINMNWSDKFNVDAMQYLMYLVWNAGRDENEKQKEINNCFNARVSEFQASIMSSIIKDYQQELEIRKNKSLLLDRFFNPQLLLHNKYDVYSFYKYIVMTSKANEIYPNKWLTGKLYPNLVCDKNYFEDIYKNMLLLKDSHICINLDIPMEEIKRISDFISI